MTSQLCGIKVTGEFAANSPFSDVVAFGYDDGPTTGIVRCAGCADAYRFDVLAIDVDGIYDNASWDRGEELRIYSLSPLPAGTFDDIVALLSTVEPPRWPLWIPGIRAPSPDLDRLVETNVNPILAVANRPRLLVAAGGLLQPIVAIRDDPGNYERTEADWFALLGFTADHRLVAAT